MPALRASAAANYRKPKASPWDELGQPSSPQTLLAPTCNTSTKFSAGLYVAAAKRDFKCTR